ncbi:putative Extracellular solute-binding protein, family 1 [Desulfamplus magnetovallimortis]|uniref:Putative Extracellular solute-binding protein, family 1 n=1 Tax=Desulfamplus magnetovallimortis TaxID=1246637 RepID=A0A1W1HEX7_9BACT|nr:extracellular solute-binding protein [Desulfamplus magnetovallimortis]SLM30932.1 putative Extracellular solute-binding protein, family 1 [Desulfamplus magnetovallimortis]
MYFSKKINSLFVFFILLFTITGLAFGEQVTLSMLCWEGYAKPYVEQYKKLIKKKYNVDIEIDISNLSDPGEFWEKSRGKKVDIISPAHNLLKSKQWPFIRGKIALPVNLDNIPNYNHIIPFLKKNSFVSDTDNIYAVPYTMGTYGLAYNADKVEKPGSWDVLWSDAAKNKITLSKDYSDCNVYVTALLLGAAYENLYDYDKLISQINKNTLQTKLNQLVHNTHSLWQGTADYKEFKNLIYASTWGYAVAQANQNGGNWKMATPKEGTTMWVDHWVVTYALKDQPLKRKLAEEWINYSLSPELQIGVIRNWGVAPVVSNINDRLTENEISIYKSGDNEYWQKLSMWENQTARTRNGYKKMWDIAQTAR